MPYKEETMQIGDTVWRKDFGVGKIVDISTGPVPYLIYFYKENVILHDGFGRGSDCHYYWCAPRTFILISRPLFSLIERRRNG